MMNFWLTKARAPFAFLSVAAFAFKSSDSTPVPLLIGPGMHHLSHLSHSRVYVVEDTYLTSTSTYIRLINDKRVHRTSYTNYAYLSLCTSRYLGETEMVYYIQYVLHLIRTKACISYGKSWAAISTRLRNNSPAQGLGLCCTVMMECGGAASKCVDWVA